MIERLPGTLHDTLLGALRALGAPAPLVELASALSWANPFYIPEMPEESARKLAIGMSQVAELTMRAKLTAARAPQQLATP